MTRKVTLFRESRSQCHFQTGSKRGPDADRGKFQTRLFGRWRSRDRSQNEPLFWEHLGGIVRPRRRQGGQSVYRGHYQPLRPPRVGRGIITTVAGTGVAGFSGDGGPAVNAQLAYPWGVAVDPAGNLFILDTFNSRVRKVSTSGVITTFATVSGWALAVDSGSNVFVATPGSAIIRISADGSVTNVPGVGGWGVAVDSHGNLFVADGATSVRRVSTDGTVTMVAGNGAVCRWSGHRRPVFQSLWRGSG